MYTLGREQCVNDKVFEWLYLRWGAVILRLFADRNDICRVRVIGNTSFSIEIGFSISLNRSGWNERKYTNSIDDERKKLIYFREEEISKGIAITKRQNTIFILLYALKSVHIFFFFTFYIFYSRNIIIRVLLLLRYNISQDFPVYFLGILNCLRR